MTTIATHSMSMVHKSNVDNQTQQTVEVYSNGNECYQPKVIDGGVVVWGVLLLVVVVYKIVK